MRVLLVVDTFPTRSETFIARQFTGLLAAGVDAHVCCRVADRHEWVTMSGRSADEPTWQRVHTWPTAARPLAVARSAARLVADGAAGRVPRHRARQLAGPGWRDAVRDAWFLDLRPDVVHFEYGSDAVGRPGLRELLGCAVTVSFRGYDLNYAGLDDPAFYDRLWREVDAIHCLGEDLWRRARRRGCPPDLPHALIPPAVDTGWFHPVPRPLVDAGTPARPLRLLSVGRLHWKKGYEWGLAAVAELRAGGLAVEHRIVGDGPHHAAVAAAVADLGLGASVRISGAADRATVRDALAWADVLVHPAVSEGFCNAVMEAQAMELPVVCTDADGLAENVEHGVTGIVVPRRDPPAMAAAVARLAADPARRASMGAAGRRRVAERFRPEDETAAFVGFFADAIARAGERGHRPRLRRTTPA